MIHEKVGPEAIWLLGLLGSGQNRPSRFSLIMLFPAIPMA